MKTSLKKIKSLPKTECLILITTNSSKLKNEPFHKAIPKDIQKTLTKAIYSKEKKNKLYLFKSLDLINTEWIGIIQLNDKEIELKDIRNIASDMTRKCKDESIKKIHWLIDSSVGTPLKLEEFYQVLVEGCKIGSYNFNTFKTKKTTKEIIETIFLISNAKNESTLKTSIKTGHIIGENINLAKDLANTPANYLQPIDILNKAKALKKKHPKTKLTIIDQNKAKKLNMGAFLSVGQGSDSKSYIIILEHLPNPKKESAAIARKVKQKRSPNYATRGGKIFGRISFRIIQPIFSPLKRATST